MVSDAPRQPPGQGPVQPRPLLAPVGAVSTAYFHSTGRFLAQFSIEKAANSSKTPKYGTPPGTRLTGCLNSSFVMQNSSFLILNSSCLLQNRSRLQKLPPPRRVGAALRPRWCASKKSLFCLFSHKLQVQHSLQRHKTSFFNRRIIVLYQRIIIFY